MTAEQIGGIIRAILAAIGGIFVAKGTIDEQTLSALVGAVAVIVTAVWSFIVHRNEQKADPEG
jgi:sugar phosphate permease